MKPKVLLIVGPTAVGKTALSLELAEALEGEIVSADSRQVYKLMDIGTAKPSRAERRRVPHHFIDIRYPDEAYSAGQFGEEARACIAELHARGRTPIVVGGSGLYIRALVDGFFGQRIADAEVKAQLRRRLQSEGLGRLYEELRRVDPETAARLQPGDTQRILRALEIFTVTGIPQSVHLRQPAQPADFEPVFVGLTRPRPRLYARIQRRVEAMLSAGLVEEVQALLARGYSPDLNALRSVGYREAILFLQERLTWEEMAVLIKQKSRNYAKRQLTWFRADPRIAWFDLEEPGADAALRRYVLRLLRPTGAPHAEEARSGR